MCAGVVDDGCERGDLYHLQKGGIVLCVSVCLCP